MIAALIQRKANVDLQDTVILMRGREGLIRRCRGGIGRGDWGVVRVRRTIDLILRVVKTFVSS